MRAQARCAPAKPPPFRSRAVFVKLLTPPPRRTALQCAAPAPRRGCAAWCWAPRWADRWACRRACCRTRWRRCCRRSSRSGGGGSCSRPRRSSPGRVSGGLPIVLLLISHSLPASLIRLPLDPAVEPELPRLGTRDPAAAVIQQLEASLARSPARGGTPGSQGAVQGAGGAAPKAPSRNWWPWGPPESA